MTDDTLRAARLRAWAECVQRLIAVAPIDAVVSETGLDGGGIVPTPHSTPPERMALRAAAREVVASWLERDLAALAASAPDEGPRAQATTVEPLHYSGANGGHALARPAAPAALDVERLSIAMNRAYTYGTGTAVDIAREYAALQEQTDAP